MDNQQINNAFLKLTKRAEKNDPSTLVETFVDVGPLFTLLSSRDHQIVYGRRGTGKTHALVYLAENLRAQGDLPIYIDMRTIGSTDGIYSDPDLSIPERATRLLMDTLTSIHEALLDYAVDEGNDLDLSQIGPKLDVFAEAITEVKVKGQVVREESKSAEREGQSSTDVGIKLSPQNFELATNLRSENREENAYSHKTTESGTLQHRVHFGAVGKSLRSCLKRTHLQTAR